MNTPNKLTVLRMILAPVFLAVFLAQSIPYHYWWAVLVFSAAAITDAVDGKLARKMIRSPYSESCLTLWRIKCLPPPLC